MVSSDERTKLRVSKKTVQINGALPPYLAELDIGTFFKLKVLLFLPKGII